MNTLIMRGSDRQTAKLFSYISPEGLVPQSHPLRASRPLVNAAPERFSGDFDAIHSAVGQLMEQLTYNVMFRWFVGLSMDAPVWDVTVFTKNCERLLQGSIAQKLLAAILVDPAVVPLLSDEHFSVDGKLIEA